MKSVYEINDTNSYALFIKLVVFSVTVWRGSGVGLVIKRSCV